MTKIKSKCFFSGFVVLLCLLIYQNSSVAAADLEYQQGLRCYKQKKYSRAASHFWRSITDGNASPNAWIYMAHAYSASGNNVKAAESYREIARIFKGQPAGNMALTALERLGANSTNSASGLVRNKRRFAKFVKPKTIDPSAYRKFHFQNRIISIPANPEFGHPKITRQSEATIRDAVRKLPTHIYKMLESAGATVSIGPNIIDKWPDMVVDGKLDKKAENLAREPGRCYGVDAHLWERSIIVGSLKVDKLRSQEVIRNALFHELGHAIDVSNDMYSTDPKILKWYELDVSEMPANVKTSLSYYTSGGKKGCGEACAELIAELLGSSDKKSKQCAAHFKRLRPFIKSKISL